MRHWLGSAEWSLKQSQKQNREYTVWLCTPLGKGRLRVHTAGGGRSGSSFFWTWRQPCRFLIDVTPKTSLAWPKYLSLCALLLWIASQRSTPKVCQVAGFSLWVCSDIYVTAECVLMYMSLLRVFWCICHCWVCSPSSFYTWKTSAIKGCTSRHLQRRGVVCLLMFVVKKLILK